MRGIEGNRWTFRTILPALIAVAASVLILSATACGSVNPNKQSTPPTPTAPKRATTQSVSAQISALQQAVDSYVTNSSARDRQELAALAQIRTDITDIKNRLAKLEAKIK